MLDNKELELVALGAAIAGNCIPCLEWHFKKCSEIGLTPEELQQAFDMADKVKNVPIGKINETFAKLKSHL